MDPNLPFQPPAPVEPVQPIVPAMPPMESVPVAPTPVPPPTKKANWVLILGIVLLLVSVLALVGYYLYQSNQSRINVSTPIALTSVSPVATTDPTANWQTYSDPKYGYSFKYPAMETIKITNYTGYLSSISLINTETKFEDVVFSVSNTDASLSYKNNSKDYSISTTNIAGADATRVSLPMGQNPPQELVFFSNNGKYYQFQFVWDGKNTDLLNTFNQILSTFQFTEVSPSPSSTPSSTPSATPTATPI